MNRSNSKWFLIKFNSIFRLFIIFSNFNTHKFGSFHCLFKFLLLDELYGFWKLGKKIFLLIFFAPDIFSVRVYYYNFHKKREERRKRVSCIFWKTHLRKPDTRSFCCGRFMAALFDVRFFFWNCWQTIIVLKWILLTFLRVDKRHILDVTTII